MDFLKVFLILVEVFCCLLLIALILMQKSKSDGLGMAFGGGAGEALFGARAGNVLTKATIVLGVLFLVNTLVLGILFAKRDQALIDVNAMAAPVPAAEMAEQPEPIVPATAPVSTETVELDVNPNAAPAIVPDAPAITPEATPATAVQ